MRKDELNKKIKELEGIISSLKKEIVDEKDPVLKKLLRENSYDSYNQNIEEFIELGDNEGIPIFKVSTPMFKIDLLTLQPNENKKISSTIYNNELLITDYDMQVENFSFKNCDSFEKIKDSIRTILSDIRNIKGGEVIAFYLLDFYLDYDYNFVIRITYINKIKYYNLINRLKNNANEK